MLWRHAHAAMLGYFCDQPQDLPTPDVLVEDVLGLRVDRREGADRRQEDAHGMGVVLKPLHELLDVLVEHRVKRDVARPGFELALRGQLAEQNQVGGLKIRAVLRQLLDRIAAIQQDAVVAVNERDAAAARRRVLKRRVVRHQAEVVGTRLDFAEVHRAHGAVLDGQLVGGAGAVVGDRQCVGHRRAGHVCGPSVSAIHLVVGVGRIVVQRIRGLRNPVVTGEPASEIRHLAALTAEGAPRRLRQAPAAIHTPWRLSHPIHFTDFIEQMDRADCVIMPGPDRPVGPDEPVEPERVSCS